MQLSVQWLEALATALAEPGAVTTDPRTGRPALLVPLPGAALLGRGAEALEAVRQALSQAAGPG